ncbi:MAG: exonuclease SbcCD subunit D [Actinobacteria bacterium]|nr:exonuclease SbcCD subunit D [Actinomycetota bacterium]
MRILHTSDWHVGRTIRGRSRADEHRAVLLEIAEIAGARDVDLVIVAGDVFDTAAPSPEAERIVYGALLHLSRAAEHVVVIAGNHDNHRRLQAVAPLLELTNVHTATELRRADDGGIVELSMASGEVACVALLPFLSQRGIVRADDLMQLDADDHAGRYAERCREILASLCAPFRPDTVNIVVAHLFATGAQPGGGERAAHTVVDYHVPAQAFPANAHYVALGHLHRPQKIAAAAPVWYPGSPLQLDFGEETGDKVVLLVDAAPGTPARVEQVALTTGRRLRTVTGTLERIAAGRDDHGDDYLRVVVEEPARIGLADEVRELLPNAVDVSVARPDAAATEDVAAWELADFQRSPDELFAEYLASEDIEDEALLHRFRELLEEVHAPDSA